MWWCHLLLGTYWHILERPRWRVAYNERRRCEEEVGMGGQVVAAEVTARISRVHSTIDGCWIEEWMHVLSTTAEDAMRTMEKRSPMTRQQTSVHFLSFPRCGGRYCWGVVMGNGDWGEDGRYPDSYYYQQMNINSHILSCSLLQLDFSGWAKRKVVVRKFIQLLW